MTKTTGLRVHIERPMFWGWLIGAETEISHRGCINLVPLYSKEGAYEFIQKNEGYKPVVLKEVKFSLEVA